MGNSITKTSRRSFLKNVGLSVAALTASSSMSCGSSGKTIDNYMAELRFPGTDRSTGTDHIAYMSQFNTYLYNNLGDLFFASTAGKKFSGGRFDQARETVKKTIASYNLLYEYSRKEVGKPNSEVYFEAATATIEDQNTGLFLDPYLQTLKTGDGFNVGRRRFIVDSVQKGTDSEKGINIQLTLKRYDTFSREFAGGQIVYGVDTQGYSGTVTVATRGNEVRFTDLLK